MALIQTTYKRSRTIFQSITTLVLLVAGFVLLFVFHSSRVPKGVAEVLGSGIAHADATGSFGSDAGSSGSDSGSCDSGSSGSAAGGCGTK